MFETETETEVRARTRTIPDGDYGGGLFGSIRRLGETFLGILQNRLELAAVELKEEKSRILSVFILGGAILFLGVLGLVALTFTAIAAFWDQRVIVSAAFGAFYLLAAFVCLAMIKKKIKNPVPFAETVNQLKKDREWLKQRR